MQPLFQRGSELFQGPFFNTADIAAADACDLRHLSLAMGFMAGQTVAQNDHLPLLGRQHSIHSAAHLTDHFPAAKLLCQVLLVADHIHQRQRSAIAAGFDIV